MTQTQSSEPIEVEATPIDTEVVTQDSIHRQLSELAHRAADLAGQYKPHEIADRQDHIDSKKARGQVRKDAEAIRRAGKELTARVDAWSAGVRASANRAAEPLAALGEEYDAFCKAYEDGLLDARMDMMRQRYEEYAPALALPAEGADAPLVPFGILWQRFAKAEGWGKLTTTDAKAAKSLEDVVETIAQGERNIDMLVAEGDRADVKALFFRTLDMNRAMARAGELSQARAATAAMEAERASWGAQAAPVAPAPSPAPSAVGHHPLEPQTVATREQYEADWEAIHGTPLPKPQPPAPEPSRTATWVFYCRCTAQQAGEVEERARALGISRIQCYDGGNSKYRLVKE